MTVKKVYIYKALKAFVTSGMQIVTWPEQFISCLHLEKMIGVFDFMRRREDRLPPD